MTVSFIGQATTLLVADTWNQTVRAVDLKSLKVRTLAGKQGQRGHVDSKGAVARFYEPNCLAVNPRTNELLVGERDYIRSVASDGTVTTLCKHPVLDKREERESNCVWGTVVVGDSLFISNAKNNCIHRIPLDGSPSSHFAGVSIHKELDPHQARRSRGVHLTPRGLTADFEGNLYMADMENHCIRKLTPAGVVSTLAGCGQSGYLDGEAKEAKFCRPFDVGFDGQQSVFVVDSGIGGLRAVDIETGHVSTVTKNTGWNTRPRCVAVDVATGNAYFSSMNHSLTRVSAEGEVKTLALDFGDEPAFRFPTGLALL